MTTVEEPLRLAADFPSGSHDQWRELVRAVLAKSSPGADIDPEEALTSLTSDGLPLRPLYLPTDAPAGVTPTRAHTGWDVRQWHADLDPAAANKAIITDLENGATSVWLDVTRAPQLLGQLGKTLDGVLFDLAPVVLDAGPATPQAARELIEVVSATDADPAETVLGFGADPIGWAVRTGATTPEEFWPELVAAAAGFGKAILATVDATVYGDAGGGDVEELAMATATGVAYLRALTDAGMSVDAAAAALEFRFSVSAEQFPSLAKLRVARRLWQRVLEVSGADPTLTQTQHAVTSWRMLSRRDPWVNLLRGTIACFAAAVGGADAITVRPFDSAIGVPDGFALRIARNTSAILHDESSLSRVGDPAGGSFFVENLSDELAERAWARFTEIEREGGALAAVTTGSVAARVAAAAARRHDAVAHRTLPLTGVSEFAFLDEAALNRPAWPDAPTDAGDAIAATIVQPIRDAEPFEALRDRSDEIQSRTGNRPQVVLVALGSIPSHSARVGFAAGLLAAGGIETTEVVVLSPDDLPQLADAIPAGAVVCVCGSDRLYSEFGATAVQAAREAGAAAVWLAGRSAKIDWAAPALDGELFAGCDALSALETIYDELAVRA